MADEPTTILDDLTALAESLRVAGDERHERMAAAVLERLRATPQADDARLPCDVQVGGGVFRAGVPVRLVLDAIERKRAEPEVPEDAIAAMRAAIPATTQAAQVAAVAARPLDEYHEDFGPVVWWRFPVDEPAWIGTPGDSDWPGYHTHWTPHPAEPAMLAAAQAQGVGHD